MPRNLLWCLLWWRLLGTPQLAQAAEKCDAETGDRIHATMLVCTTRWLVVDTLVIGVYALLLLLTSGFTGWSVLYSEAPHTVQQWVVTVMLAPWVGLGLNALVIGLCIGTWWSVLWLRMWLTTGDTTRYEVTIV